ncbi:MAG TPA: response regulator [Kofleriaceae bacterium]|nr:response regulator [Kofleriaceae bacterium]
MPYILIVDDEFGLADVTANLLVELGYEVAIAINGKLGLEYLSNRTADLVITDAMMPVMDGPEMIKEMRADPKLASIPTVLMTALPEAVPRGAAAQHDAVLLKPFALGELLELIKTLVK